MRKRIIVATAALVVVLACSWLIFKHAVRHPEPIISGKPVSYWLQHLPQQADQGFLDADHPLEQADSEIIPFLIRAVNGRYGTKNFYFKLRAFCPSRLRAYLPEPKAPIRRVQCFAAFRLGQFGPTASNAVPALIELCERQPDFSDIGRVSQALGNIGLASKVAVPSLVKSLSDKSAWNCYAAATALLQIGEVPQHAVPLLRRRLHERGSIAGPMAVAIWVADGKPESLALVHTFLDRQAAHTARALGYVDKLPAETVSVLQQMLQDSQPNFRQGAAIALANARGGNLDEIIPVLIEGVNSGEFQIPSAQALGGIGSAAKSALPALEKRLSEPASVLQRAAAQAMKRIKSE